ncbi:FAD-dependent oxidoreductase [Exiguobacterium sp. BMC-KP]|uniref:phytoene desaturase family protein n=1 Tax=Exiguobacterium sp. BMC-KP TaxID=1684312 RepID=UPI0006AA59B6|nr:FAD-dependent oxidoreductase [Exiguobacterium sp. BMC-KP]KOP28763.1 FAD-dependent oxidoreductase [Exiguobacterium sp. BMC-KP]
MKHIVIIGGGIAGLTAAALIAQEGHAVTVLEGSREWGGSAGKFTRRELTYPVGATLGMGFEPGGIHARVLDHLGVTHRVESLDVVMTIRVGEHTIHYYQDRHTFLTELMSHFPEQAPSIHAFFAEIEQIHEAIRPLMAELPALPLQDFSDVRRLIRHAKSAVLLPYFPMTIGHLLRKHQLADTLFAQVIDGILLDSMQTGQEASALLGAVALSIYHEGAYYVPGGLYRLAEQLKETAEENGAACLLGRKVTSIRKTPDGFLIEDRRGRLMIADDVICAVPLEGIREVVSTDMQQTLQRTYRRQEKLQQWATFTYYAAIPESIIVSDEAFRQVHDPSLPSGHAFISLSRSDDRLRAPVGQRTLTMSCHVSIGAFDKTDRERYAEQVETMSAIFEVILEQQFPGFKQQAIERHPGGPGAWVRYTFRPDGGVGGYPQRPSTSLLFAAPFRTGINGLFAIGDTIFPGAGTIGATTSAIHVARQFGVRI